MREERLAPKWLDGLSIREPVGPAELVDDLGVGCDAEGVEESGGEVGGGDGAVEGFGGVAATGAVDLAAANAGAGQGDREDPAPVVAARLAVDARRTAEFRQ